MKTKIISVLFIITLFVTSWTFDSQFAETPGDEICFERDVLPIFQENCALSGCHNSESRKHGFVFDSYDNIKTSNRGRGIIPYNLKKSKVYKKITEDTNDDRMPPPPNPPLTGAEISIINKWIMAGAPNSKCGDAGKIYDDVLNTNDSAQVTESTDSSCDTLNLTYKDIQPVIEKNCYKCHSGNASSELFNLETYAQVKEKGDTGKLFGAINHLPGFKSMPRKAPKLQGCELAKLNAWINNGMTE
ncbi:MAG: hypothetical protein IPL53_09150 [Ignavibacteria bacterium]|nr:hypothetical protein [Ignavibacteria bacterium]